MTAVPLVINLTLIVNWKENLLAGIQWVDFHYHLEYFLNN